MEYLLSTSTEEIRQRMTFMVYSHWLSPGPGQGPGPESGRMGYMVLRRTFHTAPEEEQGPEQGQGRIGYVPIFSGPETVSGGVFQLYFNGFKVSSSGPDPDTASVNGFCIILVPVPETASVNIPLLS